LATLAASFQKETRSGDKRVARQMLSLAVQIEENTDAMIMEAFSEDFAKVFGDNVEIAMRGNKVNQFESVSNFHFDHFFLTAYQQLSRCSAGALRQFSKIECSK
jgi:hypothetical protein